MMMSIHIHMARHDKQYTTKIICLEKTTIQYTQENKSRAKVFTKMLSLVDSGRCDEESFLIKAIFSVVLESLQQGCTAFITPV